MTDHRPDPLVPAEVDLRDFAFTPIYRARLFGSAFHAKCNDAEWRAGVTLWLKSQDQVPAGSLPNDDIELCRLAELGRDLKRWRKLREHALHGWTEHSDGRLYNKVTAEVALGQWQKKTDQRNRTTKARMAALEKRLAQATEPSVAEDIRRQLQALRQSLSEPVTVSVTEPVTASKGQGQGDIRDREREKNISRAGARGETLNGHSVDFETFWSAYPKQIDRRSSERSFVKACERAAPALIVEGAKLYANARKGEDAHFTKNPSNWLDADGWKEFGSKIERLTPEQDAASRDKADRLMRRGKYAVTAE